MPHRGDRVIEIGAVKLSDGEDERGFQSLIKVRKRISAKARLVHGITGDMLADQPGAEDVLPSFREFIGNSILLAHNAPFDIGFLRYEFARLGLAFTNRYICTLEASRTRLPRLCNYRLETVYRALFGNYQEFRQAHRALCDAKMVAEIWREIMGR